ncbi:MAG: CxxC-x17-CxxC domain-containing protein [Candidatus Woesearchaeota archaeon]
MKPFKKNNKFSHRDDDRDYKKTYKKFDRTGSPDKFASRKFGKDNDRPRTFGSKESRSGNGFTLHEAICDKCGKKCDLPFEPTGSKPIYCRSCFRETKGSSSEEFRPRNKYDDRSNERFEPKKFNDRQESNMPSTSSEELEQINRKLDKIMRALKIN